MGFQLSSLVATEALQVVNSPHIWCQDTNNNCSFTVFEVKLQNYTNHLSCLLEAAEEERADVGQLPVF